MSMQQHRPLASESEADVILKNGRIATMDAPNAFVSALAMKDGRVLATGTNEAIFAYQAATTQVIDAGGRTVIPGLNDSHIHLIRGGLHYNTELRWDGVPSLADALRMLREQALRTPPPQWVRVVGGWSEYQFAERRLPTLDELNAAAPDTPVFITNHYDRAFLNKAALHAVGYTRDTPHPWRGEIQKDTQGNPTGLLIAQPDPAIIYATLAMAPPLGHDDRVNSTRQFMRELNRFGLTSVIDAGGGQQRYPEDYQIIEELHEAGQLTLRFAYHLFTQAPGREMEDYRRWEKAVQPGQGDDSYRLNGVGEMIVYSAYDFENFLQPRPFIPMDADASLQEAITIQHRMAYQGEYFIDRYGRQAAEQTPPVRQMLQMGVPVGAGTDATRVSTYNPWIALIWLTAGLTVGGTRLYAENNRLSREEALRLYTRGSAWFSRDEDKKGALVPGQLADLAVLSDDYFSIPEEQIKRIESLLTIVGGKTVYGVGPFAQLAPPPLPVSPSWSPVGVYGGYQRSASGGVVHGHTHTQHPSRQHHRHLHPRSSQAWSFDCDCFAF